MSEQPYSANAATSQSYNKGRLCSHCGKSNHTVDKCFTLHGFPPGYGKGKNKFGAGAKETKSVNFVEDCIEDSCDKSAFSPPMSIPSQEQCQQLINLLQSQLAAAATFVPPTSATPTSAAPNMPSSPHNVPFTGCKKLIRAHSNIPSNIWCAVQKTSEEFSLRHFIEQLVCTVF
ncbi:uncharacterized protein LOC125202045 isoform X1 [Salvia hispanica]|uniref:uncharacterized protein LOC125202045 isoform X1 n=1 Tax=Salvia hispanica TaxID=49212 RepID=UPI0020095CEF|nr:uncharacterized protein LOC125202045 isoform X1 [Salvia hispanica]